MSVDTLAATPAVDGTPNGIATRTATVLDGAHVRVYRDWRQTAVNALVAAAALTAAGGVAGIAADRYLTLAHTLTVTAGVLVFALLFVHPKPGQMVRRWVYDNPSDTV